MSGSSSNIKTQNLGRQVHLDDVFWYQFDGEHWSPITLTAEPEASSAVKMLELAARQNVTITRGVTLTFLSSFSVGCCTRARTHTHTHTHTNSRIFRDPLGAGNILALLALLPTNRVWDFLLSREYVAGFEFHVKWSSRSSLSRLSFFGSIGASGGCGGADGMVTAGDRL